jgi:hypothetical protein
LGSPRRKERKDITKAMRKGDDIALAEAVIRDQERQAAKIAEKLEIRRKESEAYRATR